MSTRATEYITQKSIEIMVRKGDWSEKVSSSLPIPYGNSCNIVASFFARWVEAEARYGK